MIIRQSKVTINLALPTYYHADQLLFDALNKEGYQKIVQSARTSQGPWAEAMLWNLLTPITEKPPYAAISAIGNGFEMEKEWLRIDPIELLVDGGNICLVGRDHLSLEQPETTQLLASLNGLLKEDGLEIKSGDRHEWYLQLSNDALPSTYPLYTVLAKDIRQYLPDGINKNWWHKLLTELQMLLFQHPVNEIRQHQGKPTINSVWPWGEGNHAKHYSLRPYHFVWTDSSLVKGMLYQSNQKISFEEAEQFCIDKITMPGDYLITINHHRYDHSMLIKMLTHLMETLSLGKIHRLSLYLGNGNIYNWKKTRFAIFN